MSKETKEMHPEGREVVDRRAFLKMVGARQLGLASSLGCRKLLRHVGTSHLVSAKTDLNPSPIGATA